MNNTLDELKLAMADTNGLFNTEVFGKQNFDAIDDIYTLDAHILPPGAPMVSGRAAIKDFWAVAIRSLSATAAVLTSVDIAVEGDSIVEIGGALLTLQAEGQAAVQVEVKYVVHWREEDGRWKWHTDIWNMNG